ncbi:hypothetical protein Vretifemale_19945 [Volvox reticuliferus]|nr:hypothetical protein Vretifemale_19945 [Volvox reticuliferus]
MAVDAPTAAPANGRQVNVHGAVVYDGRQGPSPAVPPVAATAAPPSTGDGSPAPSPTPTPMRDGLFPSCPQPELSTLRYNTHIHLPGRHMAAELGMPPPLQPLDLSARREWFDATPTIQDVRYFEGALARGVPHLGPVGLRTTGGGGAPTGSTGSCGSTVARVREEDCYYLVRKEAMLRLPDHKRRQLLALTKDHNARGGPVLFCGPPGLVNDPTNMLDDILAATRACEDGMRNANALGGEPGGECKAHLEGPFPWTVGGHEWEKLGPAGLGTDGATTATASAVAGTEIAAAKGSSASDGGCAATATPPPPLRDHFYGPVQLCAMDMAHRYEHRLGTTPVSAAFRSFLGKRSPEEEVNHAHPVTPAKLLSYMRSMIDAYGVQSDPRVIQVREQCAALRPCVASPQELARAAARAAAAAVAGRRTAAIAAPIDKSELLARAREQGGPPSQLLEAITNAAAAVAARKRSAAGAELQSQPRCAAASKRAVVAGRSTQRTLARSVRTTADGGGTESNNLADGGNDNDAEGDGFGVGPGGRVPVGLKVPVYPLTADDTLFMTSGELMRLAHRTLMLHAPLWLRDILNERQNDALDFGTCRPTDGGLGVFAHFANMLKRPLLALELATFSHVDRSQPATLMSFATPFAVPSDLEDALRRLRNGLADRKHALWLQARNLMEQWRLQHPAAASRQSPGTIPTALGGGDAHPLLNASPERISKRGSVWVVVPGCRLHQLAQAFNKTTKRSWPRNHNGFFSVKYGRDLDTLVSVCWRHGVPFHVVYHCEGDLLLPGMGAAHAVMPLHCASMKISQDFLAPSGPALRLLWELDALRQEHHLLWAARRAKELKVEPPQRASASTATAAAAITAACPLAVQRVRERGRVPMRDEPRQEVQVDGAIVEGGGDVHPHTLSAVPHLQRHQLHQPQEHELQQLPRELVESDGTHVANRVTDSRPACELDVIAAVATSVVATEAKAAGLSSARGADQPPAACSGRMQDAASPLQPPTMAVQAQTQVVASGAGSALIVEGASRGQELHHQLQHEQVQKLPRAMAAAEEREKAAECRESGCGAPAMGALLISESAPATPTAYERCEKPLAPEALVVEVGKHMECHAGATQITAPAPALAATESTKTQEAMPTPTASTAPAPPVADMAVTMPSCCCRTALGSSVTQIQQHRSPTSSAVSRIITGLGRSGSMDAPKDACGCGRKEHREAEEEDDGKKGGCQCKGRQDQHQQAATTSIGVIMAAGCGTAAEPDVGASSVDDAAGHAQLVLPPSIASSSAPTQEVPSDSSVVFNEGADRNCDQRGIAAAPDALVGSSGLLVPGATVVESGEVATGIAGVGIAVLDPALAEEPAAGEASAIASAASARDRDSAGSMLAADVPVAAAAAMAEIEKDAGAPDATSEMLAVPCTVHATGGMGGIVVDDTGQSGSNCAGPPPTALTNAASDIPATDDPAGFIKSAFAVAALLTAATTRVTPMLSGAEAGSGGCGGNMVTDGHDAGVVLSGANVEGIEAKTDTGDGGGEAVAAAAVAADGRVETPVDQALAIVPTVSPAVSATVPGTAGGMQMDCAHPDEAVPDSRSPEDRLLAGANLDLGSKSVPAPGHLKEELRMALVPGCQGAPMFRDTASLPLPQPSEAATVEADPLRKLLVLQLLLSEERLLKGRRSLVTMAQLSCTSQFCSRSQHQGQAAVLDQPATSQLWAMTVRDELQVLARCRVNALERLSKLAILVPPSTPQTPLLPMVGQVVTALASLQGASNPSDTTQPASVSLLQPDNWVGTSPMTEDREQVRPAVVPKQPKNAVAEEQGERAARRDAPAAASGDPAAVLGPNLDPPRRMTRGSKQRQVLQHPGVQEKPAKGPDNPRKQRQLLQLSVAAAEARARAVEGRKAATAATAPSGGNSGPAKRKISEDLPLSLLAIKATARGAAPRQKGAPAPVKRSVKGGGNSAAGAVSSRPQTDRQPPVGSAPLDSTQRKRGRAEWPGGAVAKKARGAASAAALPVAVASAAEKPRSEKVGRAQVAAGASVAAVMMVMGGSVGAPTSEHSVALNNARDAFLTQSILVGLALNVSYTRCHQELVRLRRRRAEETAAPTAGEAEGAVGMLVDDARSMQAVR